jgi:hypothetical protein
MADSTAEYWVVCSADLMAASWESMKAVK